MLRQKRFSCFAFLQRSQSCVAAREFSVFRAWYSGAASFLFAEKRENNMRNKSCAVIAEAPLCFPWGYDEEDQSCVGLKLLLLNRLSFLQAEGVMRFLIPMDDGFGLYAAELSASMTENNAELQIYTLIPFEEQAVKWPPDLRNRYFAVQEHCTEPIPVSVVRTPTCELDAMLEAVDQADYVLAVCSAEQPQDRNFAAALRYAQKSGREVQVIVPPKLY